MLRFSIRDLLWLTALVAMGAGWLLHVRALKIRHLETEKRIMQNELDNTRRLLDAFDKMGVPIEDGR
jgi:hypothetical protein